MPDFPWDLKTGVAASRFLLRYWGEVMVASPGRTKKRLDEYPLFAGTGFGDRVLGPGLQGNDRNFGRAAEAEWQVDRADAPVDVELRSVAQLKRPSTYLVPISGRSSGGRNGRRIWPPWVCPERTRSTWCPRTSSAKSGSCASRIRGSLSGFLPAGRAVRMSGCCCRASCDAGKPEAPAVALKGHRTICQHGNVMG